MNLREFVRESLTEISEALQEANESYKESREDASNPFLLSPGRKEGEGTGIHFDLAVTTKTESGTAGKAGVSIKIAELSTGGESQKSKESISRISFTVHIGQWLGG